MGSSITYTGVERFTALECYKTSSAFRTQNTISVQRKPNFAAWYKICYFIVNFVINCKGIKVKPG